MLLALACAAGASLSGLWKQKGAVEVQDVDIRHPWQSTVALFRSKWFLIGWVIAVVAWLMHVGALALAPLSLAQAVISGGIVLLGLIAERFFDLEVTRRQWIGLGLLGLGMAVLGVAAHGDKNHSSYVMLAICAFEVAAVAVGLAFILGCRRERLRDQSGLLLGLAGGVFFGISDISIKAATAGSHGILGLVGPCTVIGVMTAIAAFFATARSLQIGNAVAVIAATSSAANVLGIVGGIVLFGDPLGANPALAACRLVAFVMVVAAVTLVPAPVRAHREVRREAKEEACSEDESEEASALSEDSSAEVRLGRPEPTSRHQPEPALRLPPARVVLH